MQLLRGVKSFGASTEEMVHLWILFCKCVFEESCVVLTTSITRENIEDIERTQKTFAKLESRGKYQNYENFSIKSQY